MFEHNELFNRVERFLSVPYSMNDRAAKEDEVHDSIHKDRSVSIDGDNAAWSGSDYSGSLYYKSNARSLYRDYNELLTENSYRYGGYGLMIQARAFFDPKNKDTAEDLLDKLESLADDYPVYDESDMSDLEVEQALEAWEGWLRSDLASEIESHAGIRVDLSEPVGADNGLTIYAEIMEVFSEHQIYAESEGYSEMTWPGWDDLSTLRAVILWALESSKADADDLEEITPFGWGVISAYVHRPCVGQELLTGVIV